MSIFFIRLFSTTCDSVKRIEQYKAYLIEILQLIIIVIIKIMVLIVIILVIIKNPLLLRYKVDTLQPFIE